MLNSKQRAILRSEASKIDAIFQLGKGGVGEQAVKSISDALEAKELIKISVLENCGCDSREAAQEIAEKTNSEVVTVIGRKIVLYKKSEKPEKRVISNLL